MWGNVQPQQAGVTFYTAHQVQHSRGANGKTFKVIRPASWLGFVAAGIFLFVSAAVAAIVLTIYYQFPASQTSFFTDNSWCFIVDSKDDCLDTDAWWENNENLTDYDFTFVKDNKDECQWRSEVENTVAFCNTKVDQTIDWCVSVVDAITMTEQIGCNGYQPSYVFTTPANYSEEGFYYAHDIPLSGSYFYGVCTFITVFFVLSILNLSCFPCSVQRSGPSLIVKHCCLSTSTLPLADVSQVVVLQRYDWCLHAQLMKSLSYMTFTPMCGAGQSGECTFVFIRNAGNGASFRFSLNASDAQEFFADNISTGCDNTNPDLEMERMTGSNQAVYPIAQLAGHSLDPASLKK
jgi:hypothetical protein